LAHSKGKLTETEKKQVKKAAEKRKKDKEREEFKKKIMEDRWERYYFELKDHNRHMEKRARAKAKQQAKKAAKAEKGLGLKEEVTEKSGASATEGKTSSGSIQEKHVRILTPAASPEPSSEPSGDTNIKTSSTEFDNVSPEALTGTEAKTLTNSVLVVTKNDEAPSPHSGETKTKEDASSEEKKDVSDDARDPLVTASDSQGKAAGEEQISPADKPNTKAGLEKHEGEESSSDDESDISSVSEISDRELYYRFKRRPSTTMPRPAPPAPNVLPDEEDEFERNPWNAVATVGLRVYYKVVEEDKAKEIVKLRVVRPNPYAKKGDETGDGDEKKDGEKGGNDDRKNDESEEGKEQKSSMGLDVDDSAKE
jgi:hypothetical protein